MLDDMTCQVNLGVGVLSVERKRAHSDKYLL